MTSIGQIGTTIATMADPNVVCQPVGPAHVQLVSAVRANLSGLKPYDEGKKLSQKRAHQLFPSVSKAVLEKRCKLSPSNWRFHQACLSVAFEDKSSVPEQCLKVLERHPDAASTTFLLPSDELTLTARVKEALAADSSSCTLESWCALLILVHKFCCHDALK